MYVRQVASDKICITKFLEIKIYYVHPYTTGLHLN